MWKHAFYCHYSIARHQHQNSLHNFWVGRFSLHFAQVSPNIKTNLFVEIREEDVEDILAAAAFCSSVEFIGGSDNAESVNPNYEYLKLTEDVTLVYLTPWLCIHTNFCFMVFLTVHRINACVNRVWYHPFTARIIGKTTVLCTPKQYQYQAWKKWTTKFNTFGSISNKASIEMSHTYLKQEGYHFQNIKELLHVAHLCFLLLLPPYNFVRSVVQLETQLERSVLHQSLEISPM